MWGGRARGGSFTCTQYFLHLITQPAYFRGYIMREVLGDIRESLWLDIKDRIEEAGLTEVFQLDESKMAATCLFTGNTIVSKGFKKASKKQTAKLKSLAGATHVLVEEMEEISEADFKQLDDTLRTTKTEDIQLIGIFNPPHKNHWIWHRWFNLVDAIPGYYRAEPKKLPSLLSIFSTYRDNLENLNASFIANLKQYKIDDPEYYYTMVEGLISEGVRGRIYKNWKRVNAMPAHGEKYYGLDFGFTDPVALVECELHNKDLYVEEKIYEVGLTNAELSNRMKALGISKTARIYADSAEPKSITELKAMGWNIIPAQKGKDSIVSGIKYVKQYQVHVTEKSVNLWRESEEYHWMLDAKKEPTEEVSQGFDHACDGLRYAQDRWRIKSPTIRIL